MTKKKIFHIDDEEHARLLVEEELAKSYEIVSLKSPVFILRIIKEKKTGFSNFGHQVGKLQRSGCALRYQECFL
jgi:hypothetical protein